MTTPSDAAQLDALAQRFVRFADLECGPYAPLYDRLARSVAADPDLLAISDQCRSGQQPPNLLLAAVHFLLLRGDAHPLAAFYPSVTGDGTPADGDPAPAFRSFCREHRSEIINLVAQGLVQTNEVRRCAYLMPAFAFIQQLAGGRPLALIEVGASAGLNLLFDRYAYDYGEGRRLGAPDAPVVIASEVRGAPPPLPATLPAVAWRLGIDLNPINAADPDAALWLRALVWPEHAERAALLQRALTAAASDPPPQLAGDALRLLPAAVAQAPQDSALCIFHTYTLAHFPPQARERFRQMIPELAQGRDLFWLSAEASPDLGPMLRLVAFRSGEGVETMLASVTPTAPGWSGWQRGKRRCAGRAEILPAPVSPPPILADRGRLT